MTLKPIKKFDIQDFDRNAFLQSNRRVYSKAGLSSRFHDECFKKMVFITKGISIIFVRLILKNLRKCTHKTDTVYLEFERNSLVFEVNFDANYCQNIGVLLQREVGTNVCEDAINIYQC